MELKTFFDKDTFTLTYVVFDAETKDAVVIDPVLDYDPKSSRTCTYAVEEVVKFLKTNNLKPHYVLETHAHADHLSGSQLIKDEFPGLKVAIGRDITKVQETFKHVFNLPTDFPTDGSQFDLLIDEGDTIEAGTIRVGAIATPGHTPACLSYTIDDMLFTGDALFMPDMGTGRCDFPGGDAGALYDSIHGKLYNLPDETRVLVGHDYMPNGRELKWETTIGEQKKNNYQLTADTTRDDYVTMRESRDKTLAAPRLLF